MSIVSSANCGGDPSLLHTVKRKVFKGKIKLCLEWALRSEGAILGSLGLDGSS